MPNSNEESKEERALDVLRGDSQDVQVMDEGRRVVRPDVVQSITQLASLAQLVRIRKALEKESTQGRLDTRDISATEQQGYIDLVDRVPWTPWASAFIANDGPDTVRVAINDPVSFMEIRVNETRSLDYTKAEVRISCIWYECDPGETASVRIEGTY